jgi:hypothetical protein
MKPVKMMAESSGSMPVNRISETAVLKQCKVMGELCLGLRRKTRKEQSIQDEILTIILVVVVVKFPKDCA